jgi:pantetheine-phosphate adenylyltransferase
MQITDQTEKLASLGLSATVFEPYNEPHRFYHTIAHLNEVYNYLAAQNMADNEALFLATIYHDIIYDPRSATNEEDSAAYFNTHFAGDDALKQEVTQIILDTKTHVASTPLSQLFCDADLNILKQPFNRLITYERQIFKEFQFVDHKIYQLKRAEVLNTLKAEVDNPDLDALITYVQTYQPKIAVYPGSFNPFHKGHFNILQKAELIFDKVIIAKGINPGKAGDSYSLPHALKFRQTEEYDGLLTDFVDRLGYDVTVIRGLRNGTDLQYELNQYRYLQELSHKNFKIVSIFCDSEYEHISSTGIRQLEKYRKSSSYLLD